MNGEKMVEISVIIPSYNSEKYIRKCLDSTINQSFKDIEIICIDDGSGDDTPNILKEYASKDSRIHLYLKDENKGIGDSRNLGLTLANGKYIYFLDSDDYIKLDALEKVFKIAEEKNLDILMFKMRYFYDGTEDHFKNNYGEMKYLERIVKDKVFNYEDIKECLFILCVNLQCKLFRRDLICDMKFPTDTVFEDTPFFIEAIIKAERVYFYPEHLTYICCRLDSITRTHNELDMDIISIMDYNCDVIKRYGIYDELKNAFLQQKIKNISLYYLSIKFKYKPKFYASMRNEFIKMKMEYEEVQNELYLIYQIIYDCCIKSENDKIFVLKTIWHFIMHLPRVLMELKREYSIWK